MIERWCPLVLQAKTQDQKTREKPLNPFDYLPIITDLDSDEQADNDEVLRIVETLKFNREKLYNKKC